MARGQTMKAIEEAIKRLENEKAAYIARVDGRIEGLREALRLQGGPYEPEKNEIRTRARRGGLKETVLELITEVGDKGLTAEEAVALARDRKGTSLVQSSVSSLLSRLKNDEILFYDGLRYRLKEFAGPRHAA